MSKIILDTDILSIFARADAIKLLIKLFKGKIVITPKIRDLSTFKEWFDIEFRSLILDLVDLPLEYE